MLTPIDIQQKKFRRGIGYDKKDVNGFFKSVSDNYEQLYRSNAKLMEKVALLADELQLYKSKKSALEKSIMIAEKDLEDSKSKASKEAKTIEKDAKNKAKSILSDAEMRLEEIQQEVSILRTQYAAYKSNFSSLMKRQFMMLQENDFDVDAYIDEKALPLLGASTVSSVQRDDSSFGSFEGDPQMRDESPLAGKASSGEFGSVDDKLSTSAVYTSGLGANEAFVDPFNPKEENGRYNPYDGRTVNTKSTNTQAFKMSGSQDRYRRPVPKNTSQEK
ncbi:MAG: DivIVA domain-containing protein [Eubacteriales bacterium]|nr:DivIVA domain-containing protein [Eubacteriales bacterium]